MSGETSNPTSATSRRGIPLTALFFVVGVSAVLMALLAPVINAVREDQIGLRTFIVASLVGAACGMALGLFLGLYHFRPLRGVGWGLLTGLVIGACVGPMATATDYGQVVATCLGGSLLLVLIGAFCRYAQS